MAKITAEESHRMVLDLRAELERLGADKKHEEDRLQQDVRPPSVSGSGRCHAH